MQHATVIVPALSALSLSFSLFLSLSLALSLALSQCTTHIQHATAIVPASRRRQTRILDVLLGRRGLVSGADDEQDAEREMNIGAGLIVKSWLRTGRTKAGGEPIWRHVTLSTPVPGYAACLLATYKYHSHSTSHRMLALGITE
jgi:hypothetical protein